MQLNLTIRKKIFLGLFFPTVCLGVLAVISYSNLLLIEERIRVLGRFNEIEQAVMETRREGKSYMFYGNEDSYKKTMTGVTIAKTMLHEASGHLLYAGPQAMSDKLLSRLDDYVEAMRQVYGAVAEDPDLLLKQSEAHRISMILEELVLRLSTAVRTNIEVISATLRAQLAGAALAVAVLFSLLWYFISTHVLRPLRQIEDTTRQIARGEFKTIVLRQTRDEIQDLQAAFNSMVTELEQRQEQLVQSQKLSSLGTLSAGIAHQINNPLNNISLLAQMLRGKLGNSQNASVTKVLMNMEEETERARNIVNGLLDFSRQSKFSPRRVRLRTVTNTAVRLVAAQIPAGIQIVNDVMEEAWVELDPVRMSEAILNIIINAVQAIGCGPGEVCLLLSSAPEPGRVELVIKDTGPGIAPEDLPHVFDPFFTRKAVGKGTGLGLAIGYGIIEECKGTLRVESEQGYGASFFINLPLANDDSSYGDDSHE